MKRKIKKIFLFASPAFTFKHYLDFWQNRRLKIFIALLVIVVGIILSLFAHWEMGGETWVYWLSARIFSDTKRFTVLDRSPLYALYLNLFRWLGYPTSVTAEYLVTAFITVIALVILFRPYLGLGLSVFAALLWIPFLQVSEPPVQKLALACSCLGLAVRRRAISRFSYSVSYFLLILAYMFRSTYIILLLLFSLHDIFKFLKQKKIKALFRELSPQLSDLPIIFVVLLLLFFINMQSTHRWNNGAFFTATWFPAETKTLPNGAFIQNYNEEFMRLKYGAYTYHNKKDVYFTNRELFRGATTIFGAVCANPRFVIGQFFRNIKYLIPIMAGLTEFPKIPRKTIFLRISAWFYSFLIVGMILYGSLRAVDRDISMLIFVFGNILFILATLIALPKARYMVPIIPVFILSSWWYGANMRRCCNSVLGYLVMAALLFFFSNATGFSNLRFDLINNFIKDVHSRDIRIMENRVYSMKATFGRLQPLIQDCSGIMALEHTFIGAFMNLPLDRVYDVWEIPPFGYLGNTVYKGLSPQRIDCIFISRQLAVSPGGGINSQIRYQNYIRPYVKQLQDQGAIIYEIGDLGMLVKLEGGN